MKTLRTELARAKIMITALGVVLILGAASATPAPGHGLQAVRASQQSAAEPPFKPPTPVTCEAFATLIDQASLESLGMQGTYLIIIARLGEGERATRLNRQRLQAVEDYLKRYKSVRYVTAEAGRVKDLAQIELYVGGRLRTSIPVEKNSRTVCSGKVNPFL